MPSNPAKAAMQRFIDWDFCFMASGGGLLVGFFDLIFYGRLQRAAAGFLDFKRLARRISLRKITDIPTDTMDCSLVLLHFPDNRLMIHPSPGEAIPLRDALSRDE
jgi:hypothetical protein